MNIKDLIIKLINATGLSREEIYEMVEMKKRELKHSISNLVAFKNIAKDLCVEL